MLTTKLRFMIDGTLLNAAIKRAKPIVTSRQAGLVRKVARWSLRYDKGASRPGKPPHSHTGLLRNFLLYDYDRQAQGGEGAAVIGPALLTWGANRRTAFFGDDGKPVRGTVPQVLEFGGQITIMEVQANDGGWVRVTRFPRRLLRSRKRRYTKIRIQARPFMGPALLKAQNQLAGYWNGAVKGN